MRWYVSWDKYHLKMRIISRWYTYQNNIFISRPQDNMYLEMHIISRFISSQDDIHLEIHIISGYLSDISQYTYRLKIYIILRWYKPQDKHHRWFDDMNIKIIYISRWYLSWDDMNLEMMFILIFISSQNDMNIKMRIISRLT